MNSSSTPTYICPECHTGQLKPGNVSHAAWLGENDFMIIPQVTAWICDVCGHVDYDEQAVMLLEALFNGSSRSTRKPTPIKKNNSPPTKF